MGGISEMATPVLNTSKRLKQRKQIANILFVLGPSYLALFSVSFFWCAGLWSHVFMAVVAL